MRGHFFSIGSVMFGGIFGFDMCFGLWLQCGVTCHLRTRCNKEMSYTV